MDDDLAKLKEHLIHLHGIEEYEQRVKDVRNAVNDAEFLAYKSGDSMVEYNDRLFAHVALDGFELSLCAVKDEELESRVCVKSEGQGNGLGSELGMVKIMSKEYIVSLTVSFDTIIGVFANTEGQAKEKAIGQFTKKFGKLEKELDDITEFEVNMNYIERQDG